MINFLRKCFPGWGKYFFYLKAVIKKRSLKPKYAVLSILNNRLFADWSEPRGRAIIINDGRGQASIKTIWRKAILDFQPDIIIDCGANYGEVVFYSDYPSHAKVFAIEADQRLIPFLEASRKVHPNSNAITIINGFVAEKNSEEIDFFIDKAWSGRSSALRNYRMNPDELLATKVHTVSIDSLLNGQFNFKLLFKIDVEGYEPLVLSGMRKTLSTCKNAIGIIEYNDDFVKNIGLSRQQYFDQLCNNFIVYAWVNKEWRSIGKDFDRFSSIIINDNSVTDLLLVTEENLIRNF